MSKLSKDASTAPVTQRLKELRTRAGLSMAKTAKALDLAGGSSYQRYEDPSIYTKPLLPLHMVRKLADIMVGKGTPPITREEILMLAGLSELTAPQARALDLHDTVWCIGEVAAGVWRESFEWPRDEWLPIIMALQDHRYPGAQRRALRVRGDSMNLLYPDGSFVVFVSLAEIGKRPETGERVIVLRHQHGSTEGTVKEFIKDDNQRRWLMPRSTNPEHAPLALDPPSPGVDIEMMGLVVGSQRVE